MTVEIRTQTVKPVRQTFGHLARRFGDKPATRYQEATYDIQSEVNHHYKPLWDPERDLYDKRRTALEMADWYALKDPRQYYYGSYTMARAKQQEALERQMEFADRRGLLAQLPAEAREAIVFALVPLRHYEWGANTNLSHVAAYGWGTAVTQAAVMGAMDRLGLAQHLSRIGLLVDGNTGAALDQAHRHWVEHPAWQGLRREVENLFVTRDWFEVLVAQTLVADGLLYPLFFQHFDARMAQRHGPALATVLDHMNRWQDETARWVDATVKTAAAESEANRALIQGWVTHWRGALNGALALLAEATLGTDGAGALAAADTALGARLARLGLASA
ncbi:aromatic/alkene monooxygenase hydroxylase subunit beta [Methylibium sp.]|jgi:phenol hydroxylase P1 protein|uniref:aromatic/alkene monooxygenase hydroxylase subunit beta n=1 Tax=Methylibium sp. TaxID=2067992 RepID=UPI003D0AB556